MKYLAEIRNTKLKRLGIGGYNPNGAAGAEALLADAGYDSMGNAIPKDANLMSDMKGSGIGAAVTGITSIGSDLIAKAGTKSDKTDALGNELTTQTKLSGAGSGALKGAGIGSQIDIMTGGATMGLGAAAGAVIGGAAGLFGANKINKEAEEQAKEASKTANVNSNNIAVNYGNVLEQQGLGSKGNPYATMFKRGGVLPKMKKGGPRKPIVVTDPNDPRLRAYNDSLEAYNFGEEAFKNHLNSTTPMSRTEPVNDEGYYYKKKVKEYAPLKPTGYLTNKGGLGYKEYPTYKKPVQPVVYQKPITNNTGVRQGNPVIKKPNYQEYLKTVNPDFVGDDYNLEEAYNNLPLSTMQAWAKDPNKNHLPDTYKKPNHSTFSNESKYYKEGMKAGKWVNNEYIPIPEKVVKKTTALPTEIAPMNRTINPSLNAPELTKVNQAQPEKKPVFKQGRKFYLQTGKANGYYAKGGELTNPEYEVEQGEVVQGQDTNLEEQTDLASDMTLAGGETHENGGTLGQGGERVFSDRIEIGPNLYLILSGSGVKVKPNSTYAEVAEKLGNKKGKHEENLNSPDPYKNKTAKAMTERMDGLIEAAFQEQELLKQEEDMKQPMFKKGGKLPKHAWGDVIDKTLPVLSENSGHIMNAAVYAKNLIDADKQGTNIKRITATPLLKRNTDFLSQNLNEIDKTVNTVSKTIDRTGSGTQDNYARKANIVGNALDAKNKAVQTQAMLDNETTNTNNAMLYDYNNRLAENTNLDNIDKLMGKNAILANKTNASNTFIQGVMGNIASNRSYAVDKERNSIARMDANRGTAERSRIPLWLSGSNDDFNTPTDEELISYGKNNPNRKAEIVKRRPDLVDRFGRGGKLPRKMKSYC